MLTFLYMIKNLVKAVETASREELFAMLAGETGAESTLAGDKIFEKQMSALQIDSVKTAAEAQIFVNNLTGVDGKVREAVSFRLVEFIAAAPELFIVHADVLLKAVIDINGNVCRNVIAAMKFLPPECFCAELINMTDEILRGMPKEQGQKGYKVNKEIFKLYWCLEAIGEFCSDVPAGILRQSAAIHDYTIREKTAKILSSIARNQELDKIRQELESDDNYYVRRIVNKC